MTDQIARSTVSHIVHDHIVARHQLEKTEQPTTPHLPVDIGGQAQGLEVGASGQLGQLRMAAQTLLDEETLGVPMAVHEFHNLRRRHVLSQTAGKHPRRHLGKRHDPPATVAGARLDDELGRKSLRDEVRPLVAAPETRSIGTIPRRGAEV